VSEKELEARVLSIQDRHHALLQRAAKATTDMLDDDRRREEAGASEPALQAAAARTKAQCGSTFVAAENSMGFSRAAELARILGEVIDHARPGPSSRRADAEKAPVVYGPDGDVEVERRVPVSLVQPTTRRRAPPASRC